MNLVPPVDEEHLALSRLLLTAADGDTDVISFGDLIARFGPRAFGALLFVFALPNLLPLPPGGTTILGLPLLLIAPQLAFGADYPWIPRRLAQRSLDRRTLESLCRRASPWVAMAERLTTRRAGFMFGVVGDALIGAVCTFLALVLILPIPLGNLLPALAIAVLALSLTQRDGLLALLGYLLASASIALLVVSGHLVVAGLDRLGSMTGLW